MTPTIPANIKPVISPFLGDPDCTQSNANPKANPLTIVEIVLYGNGISFSFGFSFNIIKKMIE